MKGRKIIRFAPLAILLIVLVFRIFVAPGYGAEGKLFKIGPVKTTSHPATLEGKTVLLRWNGKYNGDKFLSRVGELLNQQVKNIKVIKLWEMDKTTATISDSLTKSEEVSEKILKLKPDIVIASQAD